MTTPTLAEIQQAQLAMDAEDMRKLRAILGYVANGTDTAVTLMQDDATRDYILKVGLSANTRRNYYGSSLHTAIAAAYEDAPNENKF